MTRGEEREAYGSHALRFLTVGHGVRFRFNVIKRTSCASCLELLKS